MNVLIKEDDNLSTTVFESLDDDVFDLLGSLTSGGMNTRMVHVMEVELHWVAARQRKAW